MNRLETIRDKMECLRDCGAARSPLMNDTDWLLTHIEKLESEHASLQAEYDRFSAEVDKERGVDD